MMYPSPVCTTATFRQQALALAPRYPLLKDHVEALLELLTLQPTQGEALAPTLYVRTLPPIESADKPELYCVWAVRRNTAFLLLLFEKKTWEEHEAPFRQQLTTEGTRLQFET